MLRNSLGVDPNNIRHASNGQEAVDLAARHHFDIIIMDLNMPIMGGLEASRLIKNRYFDPCNFIQDIEWHIPVIIALSASDPTHALLQQCKEY